MITLAPDNDVVASITNVTEVKKYLVDADQLAALDKVANQLMAGSDKDRDYGHRVWYLIDQIKQQGF